MATARNAAVSTLHARLNLPTSFSHATLQRCLVDSTVSNVGGNAGLAKHGDYLLAYYISNYVTTRWPRLPYKATTNILSSYVGSKTLSSLAKEWGIEGPAKELSVAPDTRKPRKAKKVPPPPIKPGAALEFNRVPSGQIKEQEASQSQTYSDDAYADFVRAVIGGMEIHTSPQEVRDFIRHHILSRDLDIARSFQITNPQRLLSRLCQREGLTRPITRLIAESGRRSNAPVYIVGVFTDNVKLGEGQASNLREAEVVAQSNAMKAWYLFEDKTASCSVEEGSGKDFQPAMVDAGDVIV